MTGCLNGGSCVFNKEKETFACVCKVPWRGEKCELGKTVVLFISSCFSVMNKRKSEPRRFYDSFKSLKLTKFTRFCMENHSALTEGQEMFFPYKSFLF